MKSHTNVSIRVVNKQSDLLYNMLMEGKLDVAFIRSDYTDNVYHELVDHTDGYIVSREPVDLSDLPHVERVAYQTNVKTEQQIADWWQERFGTIIPEASEEFREFVVLYVSQIDHNSANIIYESIHKLIVCDCESLIIRYESSPKFIVDD